MYRRRRRRKAYQSCLGWRLPTEAEWEYAARAKQTEARYGELDEIAWYKENSEKSPQKVMKKKSNSYGLFDMLGNVREWVLSSPKKYPGGFVKDPFSNPGRRDKIVVRGGSWKVSSTQTRAASRDSFRPTHNKGGEIGFRPVRTVQSKKAAKKKELKKKR